MGYPETDMSQAPSDFKGRTIQPFFCRRLLIRVFVAVYRIWRPFLPFANSRRPLPF